MFVGCAEEDVRVALCSALPVDICPPTKYVKEADGLDSAVTFELEFDTAVELKSPPMVALAAAEVESTLLVES